MRLVEHDGSVFSATTDEQLILGIDERSVRDGHAWISGRETNVFFPSPHSLCSLLEVSAEPKAPLTVRTGLRATASVGLLDTWSFP